MHCVKTKMRKPDFIFKNCNQGMSNDLKFTLMQNTDKHKTDHNLVSTVSKSGNQYIG